MASVLIILGALVIAAWLYMRQNKFGKHPNGARLERIKQSPNFKSGKFQNLRKTPTLTEGHNYLEVIYKSYFKNKPRHYPIWRKRPLVPEVQKRLSSRSQP